ncbi:MAG: twin-arginine translocation signal protein [Paenibacillus sp.]|nr:twin-arginine translocation signal protein [Paenibacillus sp.]
MDMNKSSEKEKLKKAKEAVREAERNEQRQSEPEEKLSRRELITSIGMTSAAVVTGVLLNSISGEAASVSNAVYGTLGDKMKKHSIDADHVIFQYADSQHERTAGDKLREWISVLDFGAKGDGAANDAPAVQSAINSAISAGKREIYFPVGTYHIGGALSGISSVVFVGDNVQFVGGTYPMLSLTKLDEQIGIISKNNINLLNKGADSTGGSNAGPAFTSAISDVESKVTNNPTIFGLNSEGNAVIELPAGTFVITDNDPRLLSTAATRTRGLVIKGAGRGVTKVLFKPASSNGYLFYNNDKWLHVHMEGITFIGDYAKSTNFMYSKSSGGAQNYTFDKCDFIDFNFGWKLEGTNTNSEMTWFHCGFYGLWNKAVYSEASTASDQFLNYNFFACQFEVGQGDFLHFEKGGNINIWGGSYIHTSSVGGTFFKLYGGPHAYGVQRFLSIGARYETKYGNGRLIDCKWNDGNVSFISCDCDAQAFQTGSESWNVATFTSQNEKMPVISFDKCNLMGIHEYAYTGNSYKYPHNVSYTNCQIAKKSSPSTFIQYTASGGTSNAGGRPPIRFDNCRGVGDTRATVWNMVYGFSTASTAVLSKVIVSIKGADGRFPANGASVNIDIPINAIITKATLYSPVNAVTQADDATFTVQTTEDIPTVLAQATTISHMSGFNAMQDLFFVCNSDPKRKLQLVAGSNVKQYNAGAICLIEYVG